VSSLLGEQEVFLTGGQGFHRFSSHIEEVFVEVEHKTVLSHERGTDNHIVPIKVNDVYISVVFFDSPELESGPRSEVDHGSTSYSS